MATYLEARNLLAPYVDNGVAVTDTTRIDQRIDEAQRRLIDHFNFLSRREESARPPLVWQAGGTTGVPTTGNLILPNLDATKNMILALWREENNQLDLAQGLENKAYSYIERNITNDVERERRTAYEGLTVNSQNTFGGMVGRVGLETLIQYRMPVTRIQSYVNRAYQQAIDQHNFVSRRENLARNSITYTTLTANTTQFDSLLPDEVVRLLALSNIVTDNGADGAGLKAQAFELIERNITSSVERARSAAAGTEGRLHNELAGGLQIPTARLTQFLSQAATEAGAHWDFLARREDYSSGVKPSPFPYEVLRPLVESYIATTAGAIDVAGAKKQEAFSIIERDLMTEVEAARRQTAGVEGQLHNELPEGLRIPTSRLSTYLSQAGIEATAHYNFLARREDYAGNPAPNPFLFEILKKFVESYIATSAAALDAATALKGEALQIIERDLMTEVEAARRAAAGEEGRLHNELPEGVKVSTARLTTYLTQAATDAGAHWDFLARREDYSSGTKPSPFPYEVRKKLVESYIATATAAPNIAAPLRDEAFAVIERDLMTQVEAARRVVAGEAGRLHNELPEGLRVATSRFTEYLTQAATEAGVHWDFLARREDYSTGVKPIPFSYEVRKKLVESYLATANAAVEVATALKGEAYQVIERDLMTEVEAARRAAAGEEGRLHNELPEGVRIATSRMTEYLSQAAAEAGAHWDFLARRENYSSGTKPNPFTYEVRKKFIESYLATGAGAVEVAAALKAEGQTLIERDLMAEVEAARRAAAGDEGKLHNELPNGVTIPTDRLTTYLSQASTEIGAHQDFLQRREDYNGPAPTPTYEQKKMLVESYLATLAGQPEIATGLKQQALAAVERDVMTAIEATRRATREGLLTTDNESFGYHWGRIGLELPEAYKLSDSAVKRMVNAAEEQLMFAGKWVGTVAEHTLSVSATGEFFLPREVETILFMSFDGDPKPVHDRLNEWMRGGTGYRETDDAWRQGAVDRGESIDPADGFLKRKYWITLPGAGDIPVVRILAKRRFVPHTADSEKMYLRNYQAIFEATKGILLGGEQITPHIEKAKEMLAGQIAQQSFSGNRGAAHTRRVYQFR
jgi:hypothetical protein